MILNKQLMELVIEAVQAWREIGLTVWVADSRCLTREKNAAVAGLIKQIPVPWLLMDQRSGHEPDFARKFPRSYYEPAGYPTDLAPEHITSLRAKANGRPIAKTDDLWPRPDRDQQARPCSCLSERLSRGQSNASDKRTPSSLERILSSPVLTRVKEPNESPDFPLSAFVGLNRGADWPAAWP
jgi:hypothetical protein